MQVRICSEVERLRSVIVHSPGAEVDVMVPSMMEKLLFDDILFRDIAGAEHAGFRAALECFVDDVFDVQDLLAATLGTEDVRRRFVDGLLRVTHIDPSLREELVAMESAALAAAVIEGRVAVDGPDLYRIAPVPNLLFMRDPAMVVGERVQISSMARASRAREAFILGHLFAESGAAQHRAPAVEGAAMGGAPTLEGGDVLVPSATTAMVGLSERTNPAGADRLARALAAEGKFENLILVHLPHDRYTMHLDTVFTFIDRDQALIYPPFFEPGSGQIRCGRIELTSAVAERGIPAYHANLEIFDALAQSGLDLEPVPIGGHRLVDQMREQWTDGCNAFCVEPGRFFLYQRNFHTLETLASRGYRVISAAHFVARSDYYKNECGRMVITLDDSELSRARGGPRCMSMPLRRD